MGTVKSRLSDGRGQMKETITAHLEEDTHTHSVKKTMNQKKNSVTVDTRPYADASYAPKTVTIGIWGNEGGRGEPFCFLRSLIAQNILVLAYEKPISIRDLSEALAIPTPYVEFEVEKLIDGELLGKTAGGLIYTRIYMRTPEDGYGDVEAQEKLAAEIAPILWRRMEEHLAPLWEDKTSATRTFSDKQTAIFRLMLVEQMMGKVIFAPEMDTRSPDVTPMARPNGGWWLATGTVHEYGQKPYTHKYSGSGPVKVNHVAYPKKEGDRPERMAMMLDYQSLFGDGHWRYNTMKYSFGLHGILKFYASFFTDKVKPEDDRIYELIPEFEDMGVLNRAESGEIKPDFPALPFDEWDRWEAALNALVPTMMEAISAPIKALVRRTVNRVPDHVDGREAYLHDGALGCLIPATMKALAEDGLIPNVVMGKTPVILVVYNPSSDRR